MRNLAGGITIALALAACGSGGETDPDADVATDAADQDGLDGPDDDADDAGGDGPDDGETDDAAVPEPCAERDPLRRAFFGDLHAHSLLSWDAWGYDVRATPSEAFGFARGAEVRLPPLDGEGRGTRPVRLERPLDFVAITDHLDFAGEARLCLTPGSDGYDSEPCAVFRNGGSYAVASFGVLLANVPPWRRTEICGETGEACRTAARGVWAEMRQAAEDANDATAACGFVAFPGYEYSATPRVSNLHRVVIFRNAAVPELPPSTFEQPTAVGLWTELAETCLDAGIGCDVITLPHNSNLSNGAMFPLDYGGAATPAGQRAVAELRARLEPLVEVHQHKGCQECRTGLPGVVDPDDPLCGFEPTRWPPFEDCGDGTGVGGMTGIGCVSRRDYVRHVLQEGMREGLRLGVNPFRLGVVGTTDSHNGTPGLVAESAYPGHVGLTDDTAEKRLAGGTSTHDALIINPGGLTGAWAEERSRDAIFDALRRRETFATSGPRIAVRLFGGWELPDTLCTSADLARIGYERGVPMGALLPAAPVGGGAPTFVVRAEADAGTAGEPGTPLQQLQIVKGWIEADGTARSEVFVVAGDPDNGAAVDPATCETSGDGFDVLCAVWTDPAFDPALPAAWYVRAVENPVCRWSTWDCLRADPSTRPGVCDDPELPRTIQERAWSSAIWYEPAGD